MSIFLNSLATALPPHVLPQDLVQRRAQAILGPRYPEFERLLGTFTNAGVDRRHSVVPIDWFEAPHGWKERNAQYLEGTSALFIEAATEALAQAGWAPGEVDCIVTVSSTGVATPTLEARVSGKMGFRPDILRVPVFGLGCAGGVSGLSIAQRLAAAQPGSKVLLVVVEACTLSFRSDRLQKADIIATVLFGDGAAAACLSSEAGPGRAVQIAPGWQWTWPDTLPIMGWDVDDNALGVVFDRAIPGFVDEHFAQAATRAQAALGLDPAGISRFVCHPGGTKVVEAIERAVTLPPGSLDAERAVLRRAGNMSAPTVLFVLQEVLEAGTSGQLLACALGPGFTGAFLPIHAEAVR